jgi:hypothetical protein
MGLQRVVKVGTSGVSAMAGYVDMLSGSGSELLTCTGQLDGSSSYQVLAMECHRCVQCCFLWLACMIYIWFLLAFVVLIVNKGCVHGSMHRLGLFSLFQKKVQCRIHPRIKHKYLKVLLIFGLLLPMINSTFDKKI